MTVNNLSVHNCGILHLPFYILPPARGVYRGSGGLVPSTYAPVSLPHSCLPLYGVLARRGSGGSAALMLSAVLLSPLLRTCYPLTSVVAAGPAAAGSRGDEEKTVLHWGLVRGVLSGLSFER